MEDPDTQSTTSTQLLTQLTEYDVEPSQEDIVDILCVLQPTSVAAQCLVKALREKRPEHVIVTRMSDDPNVEPPGQAIALRFSSELLDYARGFSFGRSPELNEIALDFTGQQRRISSIHFQIYVNTHNVLMLRDTSTNGTIVDNVVVGGKRDGSGSNVRTLNNGSIIKIVYPDINDEIRFVLEWPERDYLAPIYTQNFDRWIQEVSVAESANEMGYMMGTVKPRMIGFPGQYIDPGTLPRTRSMFQGQPPAMDEKYGMRWDGGERYKCIGQIGAGAFATVYQVSDRFSGEVFAVKELEKRRFVKNGLLDHRVDNELQIMRTLRHPHIVQFVNFVEQPAYLYIIMELVHFGDLQDLLKTYGVLTEELGREMTKQMIYALDYLHGKGVTHRDIKPENILISQHDPFEVKLTDFGLSKVVKNEETFLKTFCGTLLYCAPEVFPQYDQHAAGMRPKRTHDDGGERLQTRRRAYSQQIDIWSYGVVLWTALCGVAPFEGKADATGRAMFNEIMSTKPDISRLKDYSISENAIDLIIMMLDTDPSLRPTEEECCEHPWLTRRQEKQPHKPSGEGVKVTEHQDPAEQLSQLSLKNSNKGSSESSFEGVFALDDLHHDQKRQKGDSSAIPRNEVGAGVGKPPSTMEEYQKRMELERQSSRAPGKKRLLSLDGACDESSSSSESAKNSSSSDNYVTDLLLTTQNYSFSEFADALNNSRDADAALRGINHGHSTRLQRGTATQPRSSFASSLSGAEAMVQNLRFTSSSSTASSLNTLLDEPTTPKQGPLRLEDTMEEDIIITPKQVHFQRHTEEIPISTSLFYDDDDEDDVSKSESAVSSRLAGTAQTYPNQLMTPTDVSHSLSTISQLSLNNNSDRAPLLPPFAANLERPSTATSNKENEASHKEHASLPPNAASNGPLNSLSTFVKPGPLLGRLVTTPSSFKQLTIPLSKRITTWGRHPENTIVYGDINDTRIPKVALELWFYARGISELERAGQDWSKIPDLEVVVRTQSRFGIRVNGVRLTEKNAAGTVVFGRLYTGDEVTVTGGKGGGEELKFVCEFLVGRAAVRRGTDNAKFVVCTATA